MLSVRNMHARILPHILLFIFVIILVAPPGGAWAAEQDGPLILPGQAPECRIGGMASASRGERGGENRGAELPSGSAFRCSPAVLYRLGSGSVIAGGRSRK